MFREIEGVVRKWRESVVGQDHVLEAVEPYLWRWAADLIPPDRPAASFLFAGPTGVGKTYAGEALAEAFGRKAIVIDCGFLQERHEIATLLGAPPGYLGHRETKPRITQQTLEEQKPFPIVIFDEFEKAADSLHKALLGILDRGILTLGDNTVVSFRGTCIIMTSNIASREISDCLSGRWGFSPGSRRGFSGAMKKAFLPEFVARVDEFLAFKPLNREKIVEIMKLEISKLSERLAGLLIHMTCEEGAAETLVESWSPELGARPAVRKFEKAVLEQIARARLRYKENAPLKAIVRKDLSVEVSPLKKSDGMV